ncbi:MAG: hypothetical protein ACFFCC_13785 [Promethearchaeota archaeon]
MVEFCEICGGMLLPSKKKDKKVLVCNSCAQIKTLEKEDVESYTFHSKISHPPGEEFKNFEKMKSWKKNLSE